MKSIELFVSALCLTAAVSLSSCAHCEKKDCCAAGGAKKECCAAPKKDCCAKAAAAGKKCEVCEKAHAKH